MPFREQTALGFAAPRGTSSIVFGLLAFNAMRDDDANIALYVLVVTVLGSVVLHGLFGANGLPRGDFTNHQLEAPEITKFKRHKVPILT